MNLNFFLAAFFLAWMCWPQCVNGQARSIGYEETFALSPDRAKVLEQLIPGTEDFYFYSCLERQHAGAFGDVPPLLRVWIQRHGRSARVEEIENRQALLTSGRNGASTFDFLMDRLGLRFNHYKDAASRGSDLPSRLDPDVISWNAWSERARSLHSNSLAGFQARALEALVSGAVDEQVLPELLQRLLRPDVPNLPALVVRELERTRSQGFGALDIHRALLLVQLDECARLRPSLLQENAFVDAYVRRLRPSNDHYWQGDPVLRGAYLEALEKFAQRLPAAQNSFKAHVLFHRLEHDLAQGTWDKAKFLSYLRLPRQASYVNPDFLQRVGRQDRLVNSNEAYATELGKIGDDEAIVRTYLQHFLLTEDSIDSYVEWVRREYLNRALAETRILAGEGDMERWYSLLNDPPYYEVIKERVEINFAPTCAERFAANDAVQLHLDVKNVPNLIVKIYEINSLNYYRSKNAEVDASIAVEGLKPTWEKTFAFQESPFRRVRRSFDFPELKRQGVFVVEFIGNGRSSRAVIKKGALRYVERASAAGQALRVLDEQGKTLKDASIVFGGREYTADEDGEILIPYSTRQGKKPIVLRHGEHATLEQFLHQDESYSLDAAIYVDRESLLAGRKARVILRPTLLLNDASVSLELLEDPVLTVTSQDAQGISSTLELRSLKFQQDQETVQEVQVPPSLTSLSLQLRARVKSITRNEPVNLHSSLVSFALNHIDLTTETSSPLLSRNNQGYVLDVLGKNGEPAPGRVVRLRLTHRDFADIMDVSLKTDDAGRISLGMLEDITHLSASGLPSDYKAWTLLREARTYSRTIHAPAGRTLRVPYLGDHRSIGRAVASLLETRSSVYVRDAFEHLSLKDGFLEIQGLAPGDYSLVLKESDQGIGIRITKGDLDQGWAIGEHRMLQVAKLNALQLGEPRIDGQELVVPCHNATPTTRLHVFSTRYVPPFSPFGHLEGPASSDPRMLEVLHTDAQYASGRKIDDEHRYILDRRYASRYPGNMLQRPGVLLNPWQVDEATESVGLGGGAGGTFGGRRGARRQLKSAGGGGARGSSLEPGIFPNLQFLPEGSRVLSNLRPNAQGFVRVPLADLGTGSLIHAVAVGGDQTIYRTLTRSEQPFTPEDQRLQAALDQTKPFAEGRRIEFVDAGDTAVVEDTSTTRFEQYDSLASVFRLFQTLGGSGTLNEFAFILGWPELAQEKKLDLYSRYACHELHFFLHQKDKVFFNAVVRPYLANKAQKTFLDHWLLADDLTGYLEPWAFSRLNIVERILLLQRLEGGAERGARHVRELWELLAENPEGWRRLFESALSGDVLEVSEREAGKKEVAMKPGKAAAPMEAPSAPPPPPAAADSVTDHNEEVEEEAADDKLLDSLKRKDVGLRSGIAQHYRAPDQTRRYAENNYWHLRAGEQGPGLIRVNGFWRDYALRDAATAFFSPRFPEACSNFAEEMFALSVLDLPFHAGNHEVSVSGKRLQVKAATPLLLVRKEIVLVPRAAEKSPLIVTEAFFRIDDRYMHVGNERREKYVTDEFLVGVAYGCRVVLTNPDSAPRRLDLLLQIPAGAIPLQRGSETRGVDVRIEAYGTTSVEYAFYFPKTGTYDHYAAQAGESGKIVASATPTRLKVVAEPSQIDSTSWQHVSQNGSLKDVLAHLEAANIQRLDLSKIAWRLREKDAYDQIISHMKGRHTYDSTVWSYGIFHKDPAATREFIDHQDGFLSRCGSYLASPLAKIDPVERLAYEHIEYAPLFNSRAHRFGGDHKIQNVDLASQYDRLLRILAYRPKLDDADWMSVTYYLLLQDRVEDALRHFAKVDPKGLPMALQYDYTKAYLDFFSEDRALARGIAEKHQAHPVNRWRALFQEVLVHLDEASGKPLAGNDLEGRDQEQGALAAKEPALDLKVESRKVHVSYRNLEKCQISYYETDVEFLFSTNPFVQQSTEAVAYVKPHGQATVDLPAGQSEVIVDLPEAFRNSNLLVEVRAGGLVRFRAYYASSLKVRMMEAYGQIKVNEAESGQPLPKVYVKVFAKTGNGFRFHKDGYTDLRGRFDYASLSGTAESRPERYALLILSEAHGAEIREVAPPME